MYCYERKAGMGIIVVSLHCHPAVSTLPKIIKRWLKIKYKKNELIGCASLVVDTDLLCIEQPSVMHVRTINRPTCHFAQWSVKNSLSELLSCGGKNAEIGNVLILQSCRCGRIDSIKTSSDGNVGLVWAGSCLYAKNVRKYLFLTAVGRWNYSQICLIRNTLSGSNTAWTSE